MWKHLGHREGEVPWKNTGTLRVGEWGYILGKTNVYPKFVHLLDVMMGIVYKILMDELSREIVAYAYDTWNNKKVWNIRV